MYLLGEAYAFGVVWSFALKSLAVLVLRFRDPSAARVARAAQRADWRHGAAGRPRVITRVPVRDRDDQPVHQAVGDDLRPGVHAVLLRRLHRDRAAHASARGARPRHAASTSSSCSAANDLGLEEVAREAGERSRAGARLQHARAPELGARRTRTTERHDVVAMTVRLLQGPAQVRSSTRPRSSADYEQLLFTKVVAVAERNGRTVKLLVVPATQRLRRRGADGRAAGVERNRARRLGEVLGGRPGAPPRAGVGTRAGQREAAHAAAGLQAERRGPELPTRPARADADARRSRRSSTRSGSEAVKTVGLDVHHRDVVRVALEELRDDLAGSKQGEALARIRLRVQAAVRHHR